MKKAIPVLGLSTVAGAMGELYRYVFCRKGSKLLNPILDSKGHDEDYYLHRDSTADTLRALPQQVYSIHSARGQTLKGFYIPGGGEGKRIVFIIHGYRSEHAATAGMFYDYYASRGFDIFCCDHASHGESEGHFIGFDVFECEDCLLWLDFLVERFGPEVQIVLHGFSMGAATVLKMSSRCPAQVRFLVEDSGYMDGRIQLKGMLGPLFTPLRVLNRVIAGYDLAETDTRPSLAASKLPILFVHGKEDKTVPYENGPKLHALYTGEKDCLFVDGARHIESMHVAPEAYAEKLDRFIELYL